LPQGNYLATIFERLNRDYEDKFAQLGADFDAWASDVDIGANVVFEGPKGPRWTHSVRLCGEQPSHDSAL